jgi:hypothetical protein
MKINGLMALIFLLKLFAEAHDVRVSEWISKCKVSVLCSKTLLTVSLKTMTESDAETIMKVLYLS